MAEYPRLKTPRPDAWRRIGAELKTSGACHQTKPVDPISLQSLVLLKRIMFQLGAVSFEGYSRGMSSFVPLLRLCT